MNLSHLLTLIEQHPDFRNLANGLTSPSETERKFVISDAARAYFIAALYHTMNLPVLIITAQPEVARKLCDELQMWCPNPESVQFFPEADFLTRGYSPANSSEVTERLQTLSILEQYKDKKLDTPWVPIVVSHASAVASKTLSQADFSRAYHTIEVGIDIDPLQLLNKWQDIGYEVENVVEVPGTMSRRGGILDIFPMYGERPARLEFDGDHIESIRLFEPKTQRSTQVVESIVVTPAKENYLPDCSSTILDYLPEKTLLILDDLDEIYGVVDSLNDAVRRVSVKSSRA